MIWNFTQGGDFLTDASTAARTQLMDLKEQAFDPTLLELFNIPRSSLPDIMPCDCQVDSGDVEPCKHTLFIAHDEGFEFCDERTKINLNF